MEHDYKSFLFPSPSPPAGQIPHCDCFFVSSYVNVRNMTGNGQGENDSPSTGPMNCEDVIRSQVRGHLNRIYWTTPSAISNQTFNKSNVNQFYSLIDSLDCKPPREVPMGKKAATGTSLVPSHRENVQIDTQDVNVCSCSQFAGVR